MKSVIDGLLESKIIDLCDSGHYGFWTARGYLTPHGLRAVADEIDKLNKPWDLQIQHMYTRYLRVCGKCSENREILTLGIMTSGSWECEMCGDVSETNPSLIHNPNYCEPPHETT